MNNAAVINSARELSITHTDMPSPTAGEVRLSVAYCGLCGSDLHLFFGPPQPAVGHVLGHEFSGVVSEIGPGVTDWREGDRVVVRPIDSCGACTACSEDDGICLTGLMRGPGLGRPGGLAQTLTVPVHMLHRIPDALSLRDAALTEPLAVVMRGVRRACLRADDAVVITGAGAIGMLTLAVLQARGLTRLMVVEPNSERLLKARRRGVIATAPGQLGAVASENFPDGVAAVIDCSGHPDCLQQAVDVAGYGARIVILGVPAAPSEVQLMAVAVKELSIVGSTAYSKRDFTEALEILVSGRLITDELITSEVSLSQAEAKLHELQSGSSHDIKVLVRHDVD